jgi:hypothetical protein
MQQQHQATVMAGAEPGPEACDWEDLPDEVLLRLFAELDCRAVLRLGACSRRLRAAAVLPAAWRVARVELSGIDRPRQRQVHREPEPEPWERGLSKKLSYLLRHGAEEAGLGMQPDGFVLLAELLALPQMRPRHDARTATATAAEVRQVAANDPRRFTLRDAPGGAAWIRANGGHTLPIMAGSESGLLPRLRRLAGGTLEGLELHGMPLTHLRDLSDDLLVGCLGPLLRRLVLPGTTDVQRDVTARGLAALPYGPATEALVFGRAGEAVTDAVLAAVAAADPRGLEELRLPGCPHVTDDGLARRGRGAAILHCHFRSLYGFSILRISLFSVIHSPCSICVYEREGGEEG